MSRKENTPDDNIEAPINQANDDYYNAEVDLIETRVTSWDELYLRDELYRAIVHLGYTTPSPIQRQAILPMIQGRDIRAQAQSGTGKTAAFTLGILQNIKEEEPYPQAIVIVSTRELALQTLKTMRDFAQYTQIRIAEFIGGVPYSHSLAELRRRPHVIIGTAGRLCHILRQKDLNTKKMRLCVIDEADEMMKEGFGQDIQEIFEYLSPEAQVAMFSATWGVNETTMARQLLNDPFEITISPDKLTLKGITQYYIKLGPSKGRDINDNIKMTSLQDIFRQVNTGQTIIFVNTRDKAESVHAMFKKIKLNAPLIHSNMDGARRADIIEQFRSSKFNILITTDLLGRGIDMQGIRTVINYDLPAPDKMDFYLHRIGRSGRFGRIGKAVNLCFDEDLRQLMSYAEENKTKIEPLPQNLESAFK